MRNCVDRKESQCRLIWSIKKTFQEKKDNLQRLPDATASNSLYFPQNATIYLKLLTHNDIIILYKYEKEGY